MGGIKGFKSQKMLKKNIAGQLEQNVLDTERYATIQELTGDMYGLDTVIHGVYKVSVVSLTAAANSNLRVLVATSHGASKGDMVRFVASSIEAPVLSVPDANTIILGSELTFDPTGLSFDVFRHITPLYGSDGALSVSSGPVQYVLNSLTTTVNKDTTTPANSRPLPTEILSSTGVSVGVTASNELKVFDNILITNVGALADAAATTDTGSFSIISFIKRSMQNWTSILAKVPTLTVTATRLLVDGSGVTQPISGTITANAGTNLNTSALALETTQTTQNTLIGIVTETAPATDTASSGLNGRLQRIAQRLSSLISLFPTALGQGTMSTSMKVVLPSDQSAIPVTGSFWQATQPVSIAAMPSTPVTGTFWQATQPVSIASSVSTIEQPLAAGTITNTQKSVGTTAVRATVSGTAPSARKKLIMKPSKNNTGAIYYGSSAVTTANGLEIIGPDSITFLNENNDYYLISDTAAQVVEILEVY